jgi:sphingolipid delta-4 desaturase
MKNKKIYQKDWEIRTFNTPLRKLIYIILEPFFYSLRPYFVNPKTPNFWEIGNIIVVLTADYLIFKYFGFKALLYLFLSTYLSLGPHPGI